MLERRGKLKKTCTDCDSVIHHTLWMTKTDEYSHTSNYIYLLSKPSTSVPSLKQKNSRWVRPWVRHGFFELGHHCPGPNLDPRKDIEQIAKALSRSSHLGPMEMALGPGEWMKWRSTISTFVGSFLKWSFCWITWVRKSCTVLGGGFKYFLFAPLFGEDSHFD